MKDYLDSILYISGNIRALRVAITRNIPRYYSQLAYYNKIILTYICTNIKCSRLYIILNMWTQCHNGKLLNRLHHSLQPITKVI